MSSADNTAWPRPEPFDSGVLALEHGHRMAYEQSGARDGIPVVVLHGGPGSGASPRHRDFFDAGRYRIVQFDQRGCGRSEPLGETAHNHTEALVADIEKLRAQLGIERWLVFGGSWGASLALAYAARHASSVCALILRGIFLTGKGDVDWFFHGTAQFAPAAHARFMQQVPSRWRGRVVTWLDRLFQSDDSERKQRVAAAWQDYEQALSSPDQLACTRAATIGTPALSAKYAVQAHYLARRCFLGERALLQTASSLRNQPVALVHGTLDMVCQPASAWRVQRCIAGSRLAWATGAGHDPYHPATLALLRDATRAFAARGDFRAWPEPTA